MEGHSTQEILLSQKYPSEQVIHYFISVLQSLQFETTQREHWLPAGQSAANETERRVINRKMSLFEFGINIIYK